MGIPLWSVTACISPSAIELQWSVLQFPVCFAGFHPLPFVSVINCLKSVQFRVHTSLGKQYVSLDQWKSLVFKSHGFSTRRKLLFLDKRKIILMPANKSVSAMAVFGRERPQDSVRAREDPRTRSRVPAGKRPEPDLAEPAPSFPWVSLARGQTIRTRARGRASREKDVHAG